MAQNYLASAQTTANNAYAPYVSNAGEDFNNYRNFGYNAMQGLQSETGGQDPAEWMNQGISMHPDDIYNQIMSGWSLSPAAQQQMNYELDAANNAAEASGMLGSGENIGQNMSIAQKIVAGDQQQYLKDIGKINDQQMDWLHGYRGEQKGLGRLFGNVVNKEFSGSRDLANLTYRIQNSSQRMENQRQAQQGKAASSVLGDLFDAAFMLL